MNFTWQSTTCKLSFNLADILTTNTCKFNLNYVKIIDTLNFFYTVILDWNNFKRLNVVPLRFFIVSVKKVSNQNWNISPWIIKIFANNFVYIFTYDYGIDKRKSYVKYTKIDVSMCKNKRAMYIEAKLRRNKNSLFENIILIDKITDKTFHNLIFFKPYQDYYILYLNSNLNEIIPMKKIKNFQCLCCSLGFPSIKIHIHRY